MLVYRICGIEEINNILSDKNFNNVGKKCSIRRNINTHLYKEDKKYLHFFKEFSSIFYFNVDNDKYICVYDIPFYLLDKSKGFGFYPDLFEFKCIKSIREYAVEIDELKFNNLIKVFKVKGNIDIEDYMFGNVVNNLEIIYEMKKDKNNKKLILTKNK